MYSHDLDERMLKLLNAERGIGELDILVGILLGELDPECVFTEYDPETGWAGFASPAWQSWKRHQNKVFDRTEELLNIPAFLLEPPHFGQVPPYSRDTDIALSLLPENSEVVLTQRNTSNTCCVNAHFLSLGSTLALSVIGAFLRMKQAGELDHGGEFARINVA